MGWDEQGLTPELQRYYGKIFEGTVIIRSPGSNPFDALDSFGYIQFEKAGTKRQVMITDMLISQGFNAIADLVQAAKNAWFNPQHEFWTTGATVTLAYEPLGEDAQLLERVQYWRTFFDT